MSAPLTSPNAALDSESPSVLGIDAAWTRTQPSGLALVQRQAGVWKLIAVASSYAAYSGAAVPAAGAFHEIDVTALVSATRRRCGTAPSLVAVDMPLAHHPIIMRREADNAVSRVYGARRCSTHTPNAVRPGPISDRMTAAFAAAGYLLATQRVKGPSLIEVYPHPALVELAGAPERLKYKVAKARAYWPNVAPDERRSNLRAVWRSIIDLLGEQIDGVTERLPMPQHDAGGRALKAFEDTLDAVVCAWVGICVIEGRARPYGDDSSSIWI